MLESARGNKLMLMNGPTLFGMWIWWFSFFFFLFWS